MYVEMRQINKTYGDYLASDNVSFGIEKGKLVALLGPSGSGKTTLLRMIAGLETPNSGDIYIHIGDRKAETAKKGQPVTIQLDREVDVSRGCVFSINSGVKTADALRATILWMDDEELFEGKNFFVKLGTKMIPGSITKIEYTIDVNTGAQKPADKLAKNGIAVCQIALADRIVADAFKHHKTMGELILIDRVTNMTSACGVVEQVYEGAGDFESRVDRQVRARLKGQTAKVILFSRDQGFAKETIQEIEKILTIAGRHTYFYQPEAMDDVDLVIRHLHHAGIIVLVLGTDEQLAQITAGDAIVYRGSWEDQKKSEISEIAREIQRVSRMEAEPVHDGDYI